MLQINQFDLNQEQANLNQIEVLKGPQGAIYGLNGVAGAIIIKTKKPGRDSDADAMVGQSRGCMRDLVPRALIGNSLNG